MVTREEADEEGIMELREFGEDFPSLKNKFLIHETSSYDIECKYGRKISDELDLYEGIISIGFTMLNKHCLDKQRVREAIKKIEDKYPDSNYASDDYPGTEQVCEWIKKELGLDN